MKKILVTLLFFTALIQAYAQEKYFYLNLDFNTPLTNTDWLGSSSSRGARVGYRKFINEKFSVGGDFAWSYYMQYKPKEEFTNGTNTTTTDYYNYVSSYSLALSGQYNFSVGREGIVPYAGLGLGAATNEYRQYYNIYTDSERSWGFLARPEAGVLVRVSKRRSIGAMAGIHYDFSTNKSDNYEYSNFSVFGVNIGVMFMDW